jgi:hypothetical protein
MLGVNLPQYNFFVETLVMPHNGAVLVSLIQLEKTTLAAEIKTFVRIVYSG